MRRPVALSYSLSSASPFLSSPPTCLFFYSVGADIGMTPVQVPTGPIGAPDHITHLTVVAVAAPRVYDQRPIPLFPARVLTRYNPPRRRSNSAKPSLAKGLTYRSLPQPLTTDEMFTG